MGKFLGKLFGGRKRREPVEDTSEIDVIAQGVRGRGFSSDGSSSQYLDGVNDSPQASVGSMGVRKRFKRL